MKKLFTLVLALAASIGTMFAESNKCGENLTWSFNTNGVLTISGTGYMYNYSVDAYLPWYNYRSSITSVILEEGVRSIGNAAFNRCGNLISIEIPNNIIRIGDAAFYNCWKLASVKIGDGVTSIGENAFADCSSLTSVTIGNSVTSIGDDAFCHCKKLTSVVISNSVTSIGDYAFYGCESLTAIDIPNSVTSIGDFAFANCSNLTSVTIGNSVMSIGIKAFTDCKGLTAPVYNAHVFAFMPTTFSGAYSIPNGIKSIAGSAFSFCERLTSIEIPNSVTTINKEAFYYCTGLTSVTIPNSVTSIGEYAFRGCTGLTSITCEAVNPPTYGAGAFIDVDKTIPFYVLTGSISAYKTAIGWKSFINILPIGAKVTEVTEPAIEPDVTSAEIAWPVVSGAASYELVIKDANGNVIYTLIFNAQGQLTEMAFNAPSRDGAPQHTQTAGFSYTVTGLEAGTSYDLTITAKNEAGQELDKKNVTFRTKGSTQAIEDIHVDSDKPVKVLMDGHIYILRGEHVYDVGGKRVK